jgi:hypothetical protein
VFVATMALALVGALWLPRGAHQSLLWLAPAAIVGPALFRGGRLMATASLALCILPALISLEALAHLFGYCLQ